MPTVFLLPWEYRKDVRSRITLTLKDCYSHMCRFSCRISRLLEFLEDIQCRWRRQHRLHLAETSAFLRQKVPLSDVRRKREENTMVTFLRAGPPVSAELRPDPQDTGGQSWKECPPERKERRGRRGKKGEERKEHTP